MNVTKFIKENRQEIDAYTGSQYRNDSERRQWVLNDEYLYNCCRLGRSL